MEEPRELENAVILQARKDLIEAYVKEANAMEMLEEASFTKQDVWAFITSEYYKTLTGVLPEIIVKTARQEADYILYRQKKRCSTCKEHKCRWHSTLAWKEWNDAGDKICKKEHDRHMKRKGLKTND